MPFAVRRLPGWLGPGLFAAAYAAALGLLATRPGFDPVEPLFVLIVLGLLFSLLAWALSRAGAGLRAPSHDGDGRALGAILLYLLLYSLLVLGWGFNAINTAFAEGPVRDTVKLLVKLASMSLLPLALLALLGYRGRQLGLQRWRWRRHGPALIGVGLALFAFQAVFGRGLGELQALSPALSTLWWAIPACFLWQCLEAGLNEEILFRLALQDRLAAFSGSQGFAIAIGALLFGLAHAPGLWLRGGNLLEGVAEPSLGWALGWSIAVIAPAGLLFGVLWARTRNLWLLVILHGMTDTLPHLAGFIRQWQ